MPIFQNVSSKLSIDFSAEHLARLKLHNMQSFWVQVVLALMLLLAVLTQGLTAWQTIATWLVVLFTIGGIRLRLNKIKVSRTYQDPSATKSWVKKYILYSSVMSLLWGGVALYLFPGGTSQIVIYVLLISIIMASLPLLLASKIAFYTQLFLILGPITLRLLFDGSGYFLVSLAFLGLIAAAVFAANYLNYVVSQLQETQLALQAQADTDQLTQLANRRAFDAGFKREWQRSVRKHKPISLLIVDIDEFKLYNDTYGHLAGDETLKKIAKIIRKSARRSSDVAARIGGEEFAILLPDTDDEGARFVAERMQQNISRLNIDHPLDTERKLTVSIGISCCEPLQHQNGENILYPAMLVKSADYAMYKAKSRGKNGIMVEGCGMHSVPDSLKNTNKNNEDSP